MMARLSLLLLLGLLTSCRESAPKTKVVTANKVAATTAPTPMPSMTLPQFHAAALVVDTHVDTPILMADRGLNIGKASRAEIDIPKMQQGGLDVVFFSIFANPRIYGKRVKQRAEQLIQVVKHQVSANPQAIEMAYSTHDILRITSQKKIAALLGIEGGYPLENNLTNLDHFYRLGVRYLGLTWSDHTDWADSSSKPPRHQGLTDFGREVVKRMNLLGMVIDVSHASDQVFYHTLAISQAPIIASHSSVRSLLNHDRNLDDAMLKALAQNQGVIGINFYPPFLSRARRAGVKAIADHIEHAMKIAGDDYVGLGSDYDGMDVPGPRGLEHSGKLLALTAELKRRQFSDEQIAKVLGANFMRVFQAVMP